MKITEKLKEILGEEFETVKDKFEGLDESFIDKADIDNSNMIPISRFNEVNNKRKELANKLESLNDNSKDYDDKIDLLLKKLNEKEEKEKDSLKEKYIEEALKSNNVKNEKIVRRLLATKEFENGKIEGLEDFFKELKEDEPNLFNKAENIGTLDNQERDIETVGDLNIENMTAQQIADNYERVKNQLEKK